MSERKGTKALELWCRRLLNGYEGVSVDNMTTSWRNGLAFCALIHRFRPDLIDYSSLKPENVYENNELAFRTAETHLGIPALLDPEDMVASEVPDRLSLLTYLSQFYRRLGHTVPKSTTDNSNIGSPPRSPLSLQSPESITATLRLGKSYEVCAACELPVYLAQRLLVSRRLYHRSCFRCCSCRTPLSPHACYENAGATEFCCDACRNRQPPSPSSPPTPPPPPPTASDDQRMGMLLFHDPPPQPGGPAQPFIVKNASSISDRIKIFENNEVIKTKDYPDEFRSSWRTSDMVDGKILSSGDKITPEKQDNVFLANVEDLKTDDSKSLEYSDIKKELVITSLPESSFKSNVSKLNFLQTQLCTDDCLESVQEEISQSKSDSVKETCSDMKTSDVVDNDTQDKAHISACLQLDVKIDSNVPDDIRLEEKLTKSCKISDSCLNQDKCESEDNKHAMQETSIIESPIIIPPRRRFGGNKKSLLPSKELNADKNEDISKESINKSLTVYPTDLNPFSEDETEVSVVETNTASKESTNPFGSSDDDDEPPHVHSLSPHFKAQTNLNQSEAPRQSLTPAPNPFWSDGEEPSSDEGDMGKSSDKSGMYGKSSVTCSTPNLAAARRKKARAPRPPPPRPPSPRHLDAPLIHVGAISMDDTASLSSMSSHCSTAHSDYKSNLKLTPKSRKKRPAPTPPDNTSMISSESGSGNKSSLIQGKHLFADEPENSEGGGWRRVKGPAPGLPLPGRRVVRPELTPAALQTQLDLLETQQLGLERQGVLIEQMIRDRCEGEAGAAGAAEAVAGAEATPAQDVEELVIQLCELVNEKNDLFRKQAELMYIRRQQRLEQEQADIEHEIRIIQSRPAVNRIDADKAREEALVARLVGVVRLRDELVQQLDSERRRERAEDAAIARSIAERRAKRNSDSNNSSLQSEEIIRTPKKSKVKDRVKKQFKKAKNTLHPKKKDSEGKDNKEHNGEKKEKSKWF